MSLQKRILVEYKSAYPQQSLFEISQTTGIQVTRVFRLFKGASMRLKEYESMYDAVLKQQSHATSIDCEFLQSAQKAIGILSPVIIDEMTQKIQHLIRVKNFNK